MYATLTGISFLVLFSVIFLSTTRFMRHQIDDSVSSEVDEIMADAPDRGVVALQAVVEALAKHPSGFFYLLQDSNGMVRAGNLPAVDPKEGVREWPQSAKGRASAFSAIRGRGINLSGAYLFVGWSTHQLLEMEEMVIRSFAWGLAASIALALAGGLVMSGRLMHRIETVSQTSRDIIGEDLQKRLPVTRAGDELDHLAGSINAMLDRIEGLMNDLRQVTTDIAHDLRTPLTRLRQRLELANRAEHDADLARTTLASAVAEIDSILAIFSSLLRIAQIESGARRQGFKEVQLSELLGTIGELYRPMADENGQVLIETIESSLWVVGERELLLLLFANLIENALRHSPRGSTIAIRASGLGRMVHVSVVDDGPGIPQEMRDKVLQRFFRLESSRTTAGSGLGLSLASAIVKVHGATLELSDAGPGLNATVRFAAA
ncbi:MAG TPA: HAMP domain-containing sensor histidine kinase [Steroidobacteraceae bacterium]|jgi:signal transduction histidine kinase|nr:HAMP domain-containing sensor histidine kinase [Steroidobacteraceae bacterium]